VAKNKLLQARKRTKQTKRKKRTVILQKVPINRNREAKKEMKEKEKERKRSNLVKVVSA